MTIALDPYNRITQASELQYGRITKMNEELLPGGRITKVNEELLPVTYSQRLLQRMPVRAVPMAHDLMAHDGLGRLPSTRRGTI